NRLGRGGGYYDRFLKEFVTNPLTLKVGLGFSFLVFDTIPTESWDTKVDCVITDKFTVTSNHLWRALSRI
ncbi:MAG: hypothetical protein NZO16_01110, partial [Deltaproteobacteria bacterium]|nr:hypothetical protein [Deltaproteobacteria bacterium]